MLKLSPCKVVVIGERRYASSEPLEDNCELRYASNECL
jgi:hypothetical protein